MVWEYIYKERGQRTKKGKREVVRQIISRRESIIMQKKPRITYSQAESRDFQFSGNQEYQQGEK